MDFKEEVYAADGLYGYFFNFISDEFASLLRNRRDILDYVNKENIQIYSREMYTPEMISQEILNLHKGHLRRDDVRTALRNWKDKEKNSSLGIFTEWDIRNGKVYILRFTLQIRVATICYEVCRHINDLELYKEILRWFVKHEFGHVLDYLKTRHGMSIEDFRAICDRDEKEYLKYFDETIDVVADTCEKLNDINRRYYRIPQEMDANNAVGIDIEDLIKLDDELYKKYHNKKMTINITQSDIHDIPVEGKNEN